MVSLQPRENPTSPALGNAINVLLTARATDRFLDVGLDSQYQFIDDDNQITVDGAGDARGPAPGRELSHGRSPNNQKRPYFDSAEFDW